ncbi:MAG TPA: endopeptidase La [Polyangiaceae bacterium]|nr:endopeptidase La [Polyangiaceae bacterium]
MSDQSIPDYGSSFPLLPLRGGVLFPMATVPYEIGRPKTVALVERVVADSIPYVAVFAQREAGVDEPSPSDLHDLGTLARVVAVEKQRNGTYAIVVEGVARVRLSSVEQTTPYLQARVELVEPAATSDDDELRALGLSLREATGKLLERLPVPREVAARIAAVQAPGELADVVSTYLDASVEEKVELLGLVDLKARIRKLLVHLSRRAEVLRMREKINSQVKDDIDKNQREYVLRQQLKAIQDELGEGEGEEESNDLDDLAKRIAEAKLSPEAAEVAKKQLKRLRSMAGQSPEAGTVRTYLEWILDLPWEAGAAPEPNIAAVRAVLDADHHGLEKVKKRILEYLAVRRVKGNAKGPILCLIGPPGVGKTSLGKSIARALGREFVRVSLGGVHDEAQIRGHRRTYVGALPGQIVQGMKKAGTTTPVFMLDEVDKLGSDYRGDPSSALLEVLDPEQNDTFTDHYMEIPYDLSKVVFVATANVGDTIPPPLRDRMEIIEIPGYTRAEKLSIARRHLLPKQLREHGMTAEQIDVSDEAIETVIDRYTREAGVRSLERHIAAIVRAVVVQAAEGKVDGRVVVRTEDDLRRSLGPTKFTNEVAERTEDPGVATGLAWTPVGGAILFVEATKMPGKGKLTLTGQLGDVMKESAIAALSYVRANAERFGISRNFIDDSDIHIHVPAGAMPKDGPSAGVTMLSALVSLLTGVRVRHDVAMTGEITLRGRVLPIGGLKEKVLAAHRAGIKRVIVPERNRADLDEVPDEIKKTLEFIFASKMEQVIEAALEDKVLGKGGRTATPAAPVAVA